MNCFDFQQLISAVLDQELNEEAQKSLAEHLKICANCTGFAKKLEELKLIVASWKNIEMPIELEEQILNSTLETTPSKKLFFSFLKGYYKVPRSLAWASALLLFLFLFNSIFTPLRTISDSEKVLKVSPEADKRQKIILTEKDVVQTYHYDKTK